MRLLFAALQAAAFGIVAVRLVGGDALRVALYGAIGLPLASVLARALWPRLAAVLGLLLAGLWAATCGAAAHQDPSLDAWEWTPLFALFGLFLGAVANSYLLPDPETRAGEPWPGARGPRHTAPPRAGPEYLGASSRPPSPPDPATDPWSILGLAPGAPPAEIRSAFRTRIAEYHPDKVATLGAELRALAEAKSKELTAAYAVLSGR